MKDFLGRHVSIGDIVAYTARSGHTYSLKLYVVSEMEDLTHTVWNLRTKLFEDVPYTAVKLYGFSKGMKFGPYDRATGKFEWTKTDVITGYARWIEYPELVIRVNVVDLDMQDPVQVRIFEKHREITRANDVNNPPM